MTRRGIASAQVEPMRSLPFHPVLAVVGAVPHALRLRDLALDPAIGEAALVDPVEHRAHGRGGHPVVMPEDELAPLRRDLESTVIPFFRVHDWRALAERRERDRLRQVLPHGGEGAHRLGEELPDVPVAPVPELRLDDFEELRARVDGEPGVLGELVRVDGPPGDRVGYDPASARLTEVLEEPQDARTPDFRDEPFLVRLPDRRRDIPAGATSISPEGGPPPGGTLQGPPGPHLWGEAFAPPPLGEAPR